MHFPLIISSSSRVIGRSRWENLHLHDSGNVSLRLSNADGKHNLWCPPLTVTSKFLKPLGKEVRHKSSKALSALSTLRVEEKSKFLKFLIFPLDWAEISSTSNPGNVTSTQLIRQLPYAYNSRNRLRKSQRYNVLVSSKLTLRALRRSGNFKFFNSRILLCCNLSSMRDAGNSKPSRPSMSQSERSRISTESGNFRDDNLLPILTCKIIVVNIGGFPVTSFSISGTEQFFISNSLSVSGNSIQFEGKLEMYSNVNVSSLGGNKPHARSRYLHSSSLRPFGRTIRVKFL